MNAIPNETPFYITAGILRREHVCPSQYDRFVSTFGSRSRVYLTLDNLRRAMDNGLQITWLIWRLFDQETGTAHYNRVADRRAFALAEAFAALTNYDCRLLPGKEKALARCYNRLVRFTAQSVSSRSGPHRV